MSAGEFVELSEADCAMVGEVLFNALCEVREDQWSDYAHVVETFRRVAPAHLLKMWDDRQQD